MYDLARLRVLRAVADQGTFAAAAEAMHLTPSAVSQQMSKLEREARCRLVQRRGRRARLTEEGALLAKHAERILGAVAEAEADLDERRGQVLGELTVSAFPSAARGLLPAVLADLAGRHPRLHVRLLEVEPYAAMALVARGDVDVAIAQDWVNVPLPVPERLCSKDIGADPANVAVPVGHPLAGQDEVTVDELTGARWIASTAGTICFDWLTTTCRNAGHEPTIAHQATEFATQLALVQAGLGVALLPRLAVDRLPEGVRLIPLTPTMSRRIFAVWRAESNRRPSVTAIVSAVTDQWHMAHAGSPARPS